MKVSINKRKVVLDVFLFCLPSIFLISYCLFYKKYQAVIAVTIFAAIGTIAFLWLLGQVRLLLDLVNLYRYEVLSSKLVQNVEGLGSRGVPIYYPLIETIIDGNKTQILLARYKLRYTMAHEANLILLLNKKAPEKSILVALNPYINISTS